MGHPNFESLFTRAVLNRKKCNFYHVLLKLKPVTEKLILSSTSYTDADCSFDVAHQFAVDLLIVDAKSGT